MDKNTTLVLIGAFVLLIIGVSLIEPLSLEEQLRTQKVSVFNETVNIASLREAGGNVTELSNLTVYTQADWKQTDCPITSFAYRNQSGATMTSGTQYYFSAFDGQLQLISHESINNSIITNANTTAADYIYCDDDYINSGWGRTVLNLVPGFFALALLGASLLLFYYVMKKEGILNWNK